VPTSGNARCRPTPNTVVRSCRRMLSTPSRLLRPA
jgi:hypothetical protein